MNRSLWMGVLCAAFHLCSVQAQEASAPVAHTEEMPAAALHAQSLYDQYLARTIKALAATGKARDMALAAMLLSDDSLAPALRMHRQQWWRTALNTAAGDVMVMQMVVMAYRGEGETTAEDAALRQQAARLWHTLEPSNLAPMLYLDQALESLLAQAASSVYVDLHSYALGRWIHSTLRRYPPTEQELQAFAAADAVMQKEDPQGPHRFGNWDHMLNLLTLETQYTASLLPEYLRLRNACKPEALHLDPARKTVCQHAAHVMVQHSTDALQELLGTRMLLDLRPATPECQRLKTNGSRLRWRVQRAAQMWQEAANTAVGYGYLLHYLQDARLQREQDAIESLLRQKNQPTEPPADWNDPFDADLPC